MKIDGVFSGGGIKAYAFIGALKSINEKKLEIERVSGTSAGAIIASFIAAKYTYKEINQLINEMDLKTFLDPPKLSEIFPFSKWLFLYLKMGIYKGNKLEKWLYYQLAKKGVYTFRDLEFGYLKVIVSDLSLGKLVVIPDDLERLYNIDPAYFSVSKAVRMSAGFPYFFMPEKLKNKGKYQSIIVDGGLLSNFPLWVFEHDGKGLKRPTLGIKLNESITNQPRDIKNAFDMFYALFSTMKQAHDSRYVSKSKTNNIIFIPVDNIEALDFNISNDAKKKLIQIGSTHANRFLNNWPK